MIICGFRKLTLVDYPQKLAAIIFTGGCPFRCPYCHNKTLVFPKLFPSPISEKEIFSHLKKRKNKLDGIVISGGEPTVHKGLKNFIQKIKSMQFLVKLDTNGINPKILQDLIKENLLDYVAMDIKAPIKKYPKIINTQINIEKIKKSISIILSSNIPHEFRTTVVQGMLSFDDILDIAKTIKGADLYAIQKFIPKNTLDKNFSKKTSFSDTMLLSLKEKIDPFVKKCMIR